MIPRIYITLSFFLCYGRTLDRKRKENVYNIQKAFYVTRYWEKEKQQHITNKLLWGKNSGGWGGMKIL